MVVDLMNTARAVLQRLAYLDYERRFIAHEYVSRLRCLFALLFGYELSLITVITVLRNEYETFPHASFIIPQRVFTTGRISTYLLAIYRVQRVIFVAVPVVARYIESLV